MRTTLLVAGVAALLLATGTAHAGCSFFSAPEQPCVPSYPSQRSNVRPINISPTTGHTYSREADYPQRRTRGDGCVGNCPAKCQASWQRLGFRSVEACYVKWGKLNRQGIARQCEAAIRARQPGEPGLPGC